MTKTRGHSTGELELIASRLAVKPTAQDIEDARKALEWCARVIDAADRVVRDEALILNSARQKRHQ